MDDVCAVENITFGKLYIPSNIIYVKLFPDAHDQTWRANTLVHDV